MPAYRSSSEAEIREPVVERLRQIVPGCRIIHEINAASFGNRVDVMAVGVDRIAAVEIKSEKDKLDRLPEQIKAMHTVAHHVFAAVHERFLIDCRGSAMPPEESRRAVTWVYPKSDRDGHVDCGSEWRKADRWSRGALCLPRGALGMLWRSELHSVCRRLAMSGVAKMTMDEASDRIRWCMNGEQITRMICGVLRSRECVEADPPFTSEQWSSANDNGSQSGFRFSA